MSDSTSFDLGDFLGDLEADKALNPDNHKERQFGERIEWPPPALPAALTGVVAGKGSVRLSDKQESFPGKRTHEISLSIPLTYEFDGVKCTSFFGYWTGHAISLRIFVDFLNHFGTQDPMLALTRFRGATIKGYFKTREKNGFRNYDIANFELLEAPNLHLDVADPTIKVQDYRGGGRKKASGGSSAPTPSLPTGGPSGGVTPSIPTPTIQTPQDDGVKQFWED